MVQYDILRDRVRGSLIAGAAGDALGYAVEFNREASIFSRFGSRGIRAYALDRETGKAIISDDTQMTLFTANALVLNRARRAAGATEQPRHAVARAYEAWRRTQRERFVPGQTGECWLMELEPLYAWRAPGNTCLAALEGRARQDEPPEDYIEDALNHSKGCGGVMRAAPMGLYREGDLDELDREGAQIAAVTHGHPMGYIPAMVLTHIVHRLAYATSPVSLDSVVREARDAARRLYPDAEGVVDLCDMLDDARLFAANGDDDLENIHRLGEGWVGDEALAIAVYCCLRHEDDLSEALCAAVNHRGDSDSTGAVAGNILGAKVGYSAIEAKWTRDLELRDEILTLADDLIAPPRPEDPVWRARYAGR